MIDGRPHPAAERTILCVVGARPNFIKMAPIIRAFANLSPPLLVTLVHTGQHYGADMNDQFFDALKLPQPDFNLDVGSASHAIQTAEVMRRFEPVLDQVAPDAVLVVGDINSTLACALVAQKKGVPVVHVEAGLRSFDRAMPEEINRILTDQLSDLLLTSEANGKMNLLREGIAADRIRFVGNVMIDSLLSHLDDAKPVELLIEHSDRPSLLAAGIGYAVVTAHRPSNVDDQSSLEQTLGLIGAIANRVPVIFPLHPRTRSMITAFGMEALLNHPSVLVTEPLGYLEMLGVMKDARVVVTDSGGLQEEATVLGIPCITLRDNTERPVTVECGGNILVGHDQTKALRVLESILDGDHKPVGKPPLWDGHAATRIAEATCEWLAKKNNLWESMHPTVPMSLAEPAEILRS